MQQLSIPFGRCFVALRIASVTAATLAIATFIAFKTSPWPSALVIRWLFERSGEATNAALAIHVPDIRTEAGLRYDPEVAFVLAKV